MVIMTYSFTQEGKGKKLSDLDNVVESLKTVPAKDPILKTIHSLAFGRPCKAAEVKVKSAFLLFLAVMIIVVLSSSHFNFPSFAFDDIATQANLLSFSGLIYDEASSSGLTKSKVQEKAGKIVTADLKKICDVLGM